MKVRAAVLREMGLPAPYAESKPLTIETLELAPPGPGEMLVRVLAAGVCHSDLSVVNGSRPRVMPMALGHEGVGEVVELGSDVHGFSVGDRVTFAFVPVCGTCDACACGRPVLCESGAAANTAGTLLSGARRLTHPSGEEIHHHLGVSAFSEAIVVSERSAVKIDPDLDPTVAALFGCAAMTGVGAVVNTAGVKLGESVIILGLGGVGLAALLGALACGANPVVASDPVPEKLELARELGAAATVPAGPDAVANAREVTGGGADHVIETVGSAGVLAEAYAMTKRGGTTTTVGLPAPDQNLSIPAVSLVAEERTLKGSYMGSAVPSRDIPRFIAVHKAGRLPIDRLLSHRIGLDDLNEAMDRLASGQAIRQVVIP